MRPADRRIQRSILRRSLGTAFFLAVGVSLIAIGVPGAGASPGQPVAPAPSAEEIRGLRETPGVPVRTVGRRHTLPDHPSGQPGPGSGCDKDVDLTSTISGVVAVAAQNNTVCTSADIDTYVRGATPYVVQAGGEEAAWTQTDVSNPAAPMLVGQFEWSGGAGANTYTPDVKAFRQGSNDYLALSLERLTLNAFCGVVIVDVTNPAVPFVETQIYKNDPSDFWCDVHNSFVEDDAGGDGRYIYLTADARNDLRVVDVQNVASLPNTCDIAAGCNVEVGRYTSPTANNDNYVHDVTVIDHGGTVGRRAYLAYWDSGVVVLDADDVTPGTNPTPIVGPNELDPPGFLAHHAFPSMDGTLVFTQDEFLASSGQQPVQMWDVSDPTAPVKVDGITLGSDVPANPAHNLEINYGIAASRLYVGWYKLGLQAWDFTSSGFVRTNPSPRTAVQYHQVQTEAADDAYDGAWGVRLAQIGTNTYIFQSDRRFGLVVDCVGCVQPTGTVSGTVTDASSGSPIQGATVSTDTGQPTTTDASGNYALSDVPVGDRTVTASATGYVTQSKAATVTEGATTDVDFALNPETTGGTGAIKGTIRDAGTGAGLSGATVATDTGQSATTNRRGKYRIKGVPAGTRTVTASRTGYVTQQMQAEVVAGSSTTVNFDLVSS